MQQEFITKAEVITAIAEVSNIDLEKTLVSFDYCFVTKDGGEYQTPNFHFFVKALIEHANAKLNLEECFELPFVTLLSFKEEQEPEVKEQIVGKVAEKKIELEEKQEVEKPKTSTRKVSK